MSDDNLMLTIGSDPRLKVILDKVLSQDALTVPTSYEEELTEVIKTKISIISSIDSPEDYRYLQQANFLCRSCKDRVAIIRDHLCRLHFEWSESYRKALKYVETKYFSELNDFKDSSRKAIISQALQPLTSGIAEIDYYKDKSNRAHEHLTEINWAIKASADMVDKYYNTLKAVAPSTLRGV